MIGFECRATVAIEVTPPEMRIIHAFGRGQNVEGAHEG